MSFDDVLAGIARTPGVLGAALLDVQGEFIAQAGDAASLDVLGAYHSVWLGELGRATERAGIGSIAEVSLEFETRKVLSAQVIDGYFLLVVADRGGLLSLVRARLEKARQDLAADLE